jgi:NCAIR mutase (PurE)-related protein
MHKQTEQPDTDDALQVVSEEVGRISHLLAAGGVASHVGGDPAEDAGEPAEVLTIRSSSAGGSARELLEEAQLDIGRERRRGIPEVIFAENKTDAQVLALARAFVRRNGRALISRMRPEVFGRLGEEFAECDLVLREAARAAAIYQRGLLPQPTGGRIGLMSAGTSDIPVAEEARLVAEAMGCEVEVIYDVGVAGLHRLLGPLRSLLNKGVDVCVVAAGMDGALPSVVSGLVDVPVIGLPTSVGYGLGGKGVGALLAMLQTCAPGLTVVNIDNGVGAGATAALIANRVARARQAAASAGS